MPISRAEVTSWPDDTLITRKEAAALLACRNTLLEEWAVQGKGPPYLKFNARCVRYRLGDIRAWMQKHQRQTVNRPRRKVVWQ